MEVKDWITVAVALATLLSSWGQFWVKERLFNPSTASGDPLLVAIRSKSGVSFLAFTALLSCASAWLLIGEVQSMEPLTRNACFVIALLTVLALLNIVLVHSIFVIRRLAQLKDEVAEARKLVQNAQLLHWFC